jgi:lipopolysaccharide transport system permease protein
VAVPDADIGAREAPWVENSPATVVPVRAALHELWETRELIGFFARRDIQARYKQAVFGILWAVIQPVAGMVALTIAFHLLGHVRSRGLAYVPSTLLGYTTWLYFSVTVQAMTGTFVGNAPLVTKVYFPRLAMPVGAAARGLFDLAIGMVVLVGFMVGYRVTPGAALLTLPCWIACLVAGAFGAGLLLGTLNVQFRDVGQVVGLLLQLWFFLSPVAYLSSLVPARWAWAYHLNPMAGVLDGMRWAVLAGPPPPGAAVVSLATGLLLLVAGMRYFQRSERSLADII